MAEGPLTNSRELGQALLEVALALPILLVILLGGYASTRTAFLTSRSESGTFAVAIRAGRDLPGIEQELSRAILPDGGTVVIRVEQKSKVPIFPAPFPHLAGRTKATVEIRKQWVEVGAPRWRPAAHIHRKTEMHVDCWGKESLSGKSIRGWVRGLVFLGAIR